MTIEIDNFEDLKVIAKANGSERSYIRHLLRWTSLAPDIVESILSGQACADISLRPCRNGITVAWEINGTLLSQRIEIRPAQAAAHTRLALADYLIRAFQIEGGKPNPKVDRFHRAQSPQLV